MAKKPSNKRNATKTILADMSEKNEAAKIPETLTDKVKALTALSTISRLLQEGAFPYKEREVLDQSFKFLEAIHTPLYKEAQSHPDAHKIPGLLPKTSNQDEVANGPTP